MRDDIQKDLRSSDVTHTDLKYDLIGPNFIDEFRERVTKRVEHSGYMNILAGYLSSVFQEFENFLRKEIDLAEVEIRLVLEKYNSSFILYELQPGIYTFRDLSESLFNILQHEYPTSSSEIVIEIDDITRKTKLVVRSGIIALKFDEKSFFSTVLGFTAGWD